jgi:WD40 repeat protein
VSYSFISYKRELRKFADAIAQLLPTKGQAVWLDVSGLLPAEPWGPAVQSAIIGCQAFIVILENGWLRSQVCREELSWAVEHGKKIVVVVAPSHDERSFKNDIEQNPALAGLLPNEIRRINYIWSHDRPVDDVLEDLTTALQLDLAWNARSSWLQQRAVAWIRSGRSHGLLRGDELIQTLRDVDNARDQLPRLTAHALEFLRGSQQEQTNDQLLTEAEYGWREGRLGMALERSLAAWHLTVSAGRKPGAHQMILAHRLLESYGGAHCYLLSITAATMDDAGNWIATADDNIKLWKTETIRNTSTVRAPRAWPQQPDVVLSRERSLEPVSRLVFAPDASRLVAVVGTQILHWKFPTERAQVFDGVPAQVDSLEFSADGNWLLARGEQGCALWELDGDASAGPRTTSADDTLHLREMRLVQVQTKPKCRVSTARLNAGQAITFETNTGLARAADQVIVEPDGSGWAALCGSRIYEYAPHENPEPRLVCDLLRSIELIDNYSPFNRLKKRKRGPTVKAFGYVGWVAVAVEFFNRGVYVVLIDRKGPYCTLAETGGSAAAVVFADHQFTVVQSTGQVWVGPPMRAEIDPLPRPPASAVTLASRNETRVLAQEDGTTYFWRGQKIFRRQSGMYSRAPRISRDGSCVLEESGKGVVLWDVTALDSKSIPRVLANTGFAVVALTAHPDGSGLAVAMGEEIHFWDAASNKREWGGVHLVQAFGVSTAGNRWVAIDAYGKLVSWVGDGDWDRSIELGNYINPPARVVVAPNDDWAIFSHKGHHAALVDLRPDSSERVVILDDRQPILSSTAIHLELSPDGRWLLARGIVWEIRDRRPVMRGPLHVAGPLLAARFLSGGSLLTVHDDASVRRWRIGEDGEVEALEAFMARSLGNSTIVDACLSANGAWLAFTEHVAGARSTYVMPTEGARIATIVNVPRSWQPVLKAVDDSGTWTIGADEEGQWLFPSTPVDSFISPLCLTVNGFMSTPAIFLGGGRSVLAGSGKGLVTVWPLDPDELANELNQIPIRD